MCKENKFVTKDIDYTGCHPDIANALRQGKAIRCKIDDNQTALVIGYDRKDCYEKPYVGDSSRAFSHAEPIQAKRILKDPVSIMKILVEEGWVYKHSTWWVNKIGNFRFSRWDLCEKEVKHCSNYPENFYTYEEE